LAVAALLIVTEAFYLRPGILLGTETLAGSDYVELHIRRIRFAREALFGARHTLPGWYPREVLGSPFAANLQSFPWIPTRLLLLLLDPSIAYAAAIALAAALSAIFTYLFCRRAGLTRTGAAAAGGTFACAGYFASRVLAGHLPLLEAYPALPLLLWLVDRALAPERAPQHRFDLAALAFCCMCVVVAGHPQLPAYSVASALLYAIWRGFGKVQARGATRVSAAIALGAGLAFAVWWPMLLLIARSTRVLRLAAPDNDIAMPYRRLLALIMPGIHGWAQPVDLADNHPFTGFPNRAYFWDTASYIGILPLVAIAALFIGCIVRRRMPDSRWMFLSCLGVAAFLCSLPFASPLLHSLPGTLLRSPARLLYLSTFCAAVALGAGVDAIRRARWPLLLVAVLLCLHFADLWGFAHWFIQTTPREEDPPAFQAIIDREAGDGRIAEQRVYQTFSNDDRHDDAGGFDSIFLARVYRGILALAESPPGLNRQWIDATELPVKALQATGVRLVITDKTRTDLELAASDEDTNLYRVPHPAPRATLLAGEIGYARPSSDEILLRTKSLAVGFAEVLEAYDPGWTAVVDAAPAPVLPANGFAMAVPVPAGSHTVRLRYKTPGRPMGAALSLLSLALLAGLILSARPRTESSQLTHHL
jgi:hypothetical protein